MPSPTGQAALYPRDYFVKEFDALRKEVDWTLQDSRTVERNVVVAIGVFWAFLIKEHLEIRCLRYGDFAWSIPVIFAILGAIRSWALWMKFTEMGDYFRKIEQEIVQLEPGTARPEGWQRYQNYAAGNYVKMSGIAFWGVLLVVTVAVAYFGPK